MAVKGIERRMVWIRTPENRYFEEAYFVLRREPCKEDADKADILREADRILEEHGYRTAGKKRRRGGTYEKKRLLFFTLGMLCGGMLSTVVFFILRLLQIL